MVGIEELTQQLAEALSDEIRVHTELVETAEQMREAIKRKDLHDVQQTTSHYDTRVGRIEDIEERRLAVCDSLCEALGKAKRHLNLSGIIGALPPDTRTSLAQLRSQLKDKISQLSRLNTSNNILLEASLAAVAKSFEVMARSHQRLDGYGRTGTPASKTVSRNIVNKIA